MLGLKGKEANGLGSITLFLCHGILRESHGRTRPTVAHRRLTWICRPPRGMGGKFLPWEDRLHCCVVQLILFQARLAASVEKRHFQDLGGCSTADKNGKGVKIC